MDIKLQSDTGSNISIINMDICKKIKKHLLRKSAETSLREMGWNMHFIGEMWIYVTFRSKICK